MCLFEILCDKDDVNDDNGDDDDDGDDDNGDDVGTSRRVGDSRVLPTNSQFVLINSFIKLTAQPKKLKLGSSHMTLHTCPIFCYILFASLFSQL